MKCISNLSIGYREPEGRATKYHAPGKVFRMARDEAAPLLASGIIRKATSAEIAAEAEAEGAPEGDDEGLVEVARAIQSLDPQTDFNARGQAQVAKLSDLLGRKVSAEERDAAAAWLEAQEDEEGGEDEEDEDGGADNGGLGV